MQLAKTSDLESVMEIIAEAAAWLKTKGIKQWPSPPNKHWWQRMADYIDNWEVYLAFMANRPVGTLRMTWSDAYWLQSSGAAGYIHNLAIRDAVRGKGVGIVILRWCLERIKQQGRLYARLDCAYDNRPLRQYYENLGFTHVGQIQDKDYTAALYEMKL